MKFIVLALALIGAASATYIAPLATGYSGYGFNGLGWGHGIAAPAVTAYAAPAIAPYHAPFVAPAYPAYHAPVVTPAYPAYHAPVVSAYHGIAAAPGFDYGYHGYGAPVLDLWKKKKAAH